MWYNINKYKLIHAYTIDLRIFSQGFNMFNLADAPKTAKSWDSFLSKGYKYGIWYFSLCLAKEMTSRYIKYRYDPETDLPEFLKTKGSWNEYFKNKIKLNENFKTQLIQFIKNKLNFHVEFGFFEKKEITEEQIDFIIKENLKAENIKSLHDSLKGWGHWSKEKRFSKENLKKIKTIRTLHSSLWSEGYWDEEKKSIRAQIDFIVETYGLEKLIKKLDEEIEQLKSLLKKGRPFEPRHRIASIWAQVLKNKRNGRSNWVLIGYLLDWFFDKLKDTKYRKELGNDKTDFVYYLLRNDCHINMKQPQKKSYIENGRRIYFPNPKYSPLFRIEFKKSYVNIDITKRNNPLIIFPDGETFP